MTGGKRDFKAEYARRKANRIIRERETKRGAPLSENYRRRVRKALEKGKTLQQARGHVEREHVIRAEREREAHGITTAQMRSIRAWVSRYKNEDRDDEAVIDYAVENGYDWFVTYRDTWNAARRQYIRELNNGSYASRGITYLEMLASLSAAPEISWLYYH